MFGKTKYFAFLLILVVSVFVGCSEDTTTTPTDSGATLRNYLEANSMDLNDMLASWIIGAGDVYPNHANYYVMDIRGVGDYNDGHIPGAVHSSLGTIVADAALNTTAKPILIVCYTGQSAGHALVALRLSGYPDCQVLKFGMSSWSGDFDSWTANTNNTGTGHANWISPPALATLGDYSYPSISATATGGAAILAERVAFMTSRGFSLNGVNAADVLGTPANYFINNYWLIDDVTTYGHIAGAHRINPLTIANDEFKAYDPDATVVTYCWTGQTSSVITAYLTILGYDARSMKFGVNALIYDALSGHKWGGSEDFPVEVTPPTM